MESVPASMHVGPSTVTERGPPSTGQPVDFACDGAECTPECVPETVRITVSNYEFRRMLDVLGLPPVTIPDFQTVASMEGAGCSPEDQTCLP